MIKLPKLMQNLTKLTFLMVWTGHLMEKSCTTLTRLPEKLKHLILIHLVD